MIFTALMMGFAGSLHCVGMCSPLVMAVSAMSKHALLNRLMYNLGRILTYGILGAIVATLGMVLPLENFQNILSVAFGIALVGFALLNVRSVNTLGLTTQLQKISSILKNLFGKFLQKKNYPSVFLLGMLNGILPCGLTFIALSFCLTLQGPTDGFNFMLLFGAGTLPVMLGLTGVFQYAVKRFNLSFKKVTTSMLFISGCLLIVRVFLFHDVHASPEEQRLMDIILCR